MTDKLTEIEALNAYVDGELDVDAAARMARRIAADEATARRAAKLFEIKRAVAALAVPTEVLIVAAPRRRVGTLWGVAAAAAVVFVVVTTLTAAGLLSSGRTAGFPTRLVADALRAHDAWSASDTIAGAIAPVNAPFPTPDLAAANLTLESVDPTVRLDGHAASRASFLGTHGCRLSLFEWPSAHAPTSLSISFDNHVAMARWAKPGKDFLMIARDMDQARFTIIAGVLSDGDDRQPPRTLEALRQARQPCSVAG